MTITYEDVKDWIEGAQTRGEDGGVEDPLQSLRRLGVTDEEGEIELLVGVVNGSGGDPLTAMALLTGIAIGLDLERQANHVEA